MPPQTHWRSEVLEEEAAPLDETESEESGPPPLEPAPDVTAPEWVDWVEQSVRRAREHEPPARRTWPATDPLAHEQAPQLIPGLGLPRGARAYVVRAAPAPASPLHDEVEGTRDHRSLVVAALAVAVVLVLALTAGTWWWVGRDGDGGPGAVGSSAGPSHGASARPSHGASARPSHGASTGASAGPSAGASAGPSAEPSAGASAGPSAGAAASSVPPSPVTLVPGAEHTQVRILDSGDLAVEQWIHGSSELTGLDVSPPTMPAGTESVVVSGLHVVAGAQDVPTSGQLDGPVHLTFTATPWVYLRYRLTGALERSGPGGRALARATSVTVGYDRGADPATIAFRGATLLALACTPVSGDGVPVPCGAEDPPRGWKVVPPAGAGAVQVMAQLDLEQTG